MLRYLYRQEFVPPCQHRPASSGKDEMPEHPEAWVSAVLSGPAFQKGHFFEILQCIWRQSILPYARYAGGYGAACVFLYEAG